MDTENWGEPANPGLPGKCPLKQCVCLHVCVCVCVCVCAIDTVCIEGKVYAVN